MVFMLHFCHSASLHFMAKVQHKNHRLLRRWRGRFAPRHRGAGYHPHAARRSAPTITRIQQTNPPASKLAYGFAADPPPR